MDSNQLVHTTGINWEGLLTTAGVISGVIGGFLAWLLRQFREGKKDFTKFLQEKVDAVTDRQDTQNELLQKQDIRLNGIDRRLSYIEGRSDRVRHDDD
jgi:hypothetical protein